MAHHYFCVVLLQRKLIALFPVSMLHCTVCIVCFLDIAQSACLCLSLMCCTQCKPCIHSYKQPEAQCYRWPDFGIPNSPTPLRRLAHLLDESDDPQAGSPVVHCSAGIGRTGTFVAIDVVMKRLHHLDGKDIKGELPGFADCICASLLKCHHKHPLLVLKAAGSKPFATAFQWPQTTLAYKCCPAEWCRVTLNACARVSWLIQLILIHVLFCLRISELPLHARLHVSSHFCLWMLKWLFSLTDVDVCVFDCQSWSILQDACQACLSSGNKGAGTQVVADCKHHM